MITYEIPHRGQEDYLIHLAPPEILAQIEDRRVYTIAAVSDDAGERICVGYVVFAGPRDGAMELLWIYVWEEYRRQGIGTKLMQMFENTARFCSAGGVVAKLYKELVADADALDLTELLLANGFESEGEKEAARIFDQSAFLAEEIVQVSMQMQNEPIRHRQLSELTGLEQRQMAAELFADDPGIIGMADPDTSVAAQSANGWLGCALVRRSGNCYSPLMYRALSSGTGMGILYAVLGQIGSHMGKEDVMRLEPDPDTGADLIKKLLSGGVPQRAFVFKKEIDT